MAGSRRKRVLIAKPGLDGHDRGARVVALALKEAGVEVIYTGLRQTARQIVNSAIQEDVDLVGLSILSGSHLGLTRKVMEELHREGASEIEVVIGGVIPFEDIDEIKRMGVEEVFPVGSDINLVVKKILEILDENKRA